MLEVKPNEKPPPGFPIDRYANISICAKCNTKSGLTISLYYFFEVLFSSSSSSFQVSYIIQLISKVYSIMFLKLRMWQTFNGWERKSTSKDVGWKRRFTWPISIQDLDWTNVSRATVFTFLIWNKGIEFNGLLFLMFLFLPGVFGEFISQFYQKLLFPSKNGSIELIMEDLNLTMNLTSPLSYLILLSPNLSI